MNRLEPPSQTSQKFIRHACPDHAAYNARLAANRQRPPPHEPNDVCARVRWENTPDLCADFNEAAAKRPRETQEQANRKTKRKSKGAARPRLKSRLPVLKP